jgi:endonuclease YncB( thermonuclease family)
MVRQGWAVAYGFSRLYASEKAEAEKAKQGIWVGAFTLPSQWRQQHQHE